MPAVNLDEFPNSVVDVFVEIVQADAGTRCAGICAASLALADAGIPMKDMVCAVSVGKVGGKLLVDLNKYGLDIALARKSSGAGVYLTSDLALAEQKFKKIKVDESINITGTEQDFYFKQLFKILELYGFKHKMIHVGCGLVTLPEGKMSSRTGRVVLYEDLRDEVFKKAIYETQKRHSDWSDKKIKDTSWKIAMSAIKYEILKHEASKVVVFESEAASRVEGFTGPYVLYTIARINSMLKKNKSLKSAKLGYGLLDKMEEKQLLLIISQYSGIIEKAFSNHNPSVVVKFCFDLAQAYNDFYNKHSVLNAESVELRCTELVRLFWISC